MSGDARLDASAIKNLPTGGTGGTGGTMTGADIKTALEGLSGDARLDASAIKNLPTGGGTVIVSAREKLTTNRTYYISTTGNDNNNGLSPQTSFLTWQKLFSVIQDLDIGSYDCNVQGTGNFVSQSLVEMKYPLGNGGRFWIESLIEDFTDLVLPRTRIIGQKGNITVFFKDLTFFRQSSTGNQPILFLNGSELSFVQGRVMFEGNGIGISLLNSRINCDLHTDTIFLYFNRNVTGSGTIYQSYDYAIYCDGMSYFNAQFDNTRTTKQIWIATVNLSSFSKAMFGSNTLSLLDISGNQCIFASVDRTNLAQNRGVIRNTNGTYIFG